MKTELHPDRTFEEIKSDMLAAVHNTDQEMAHSIGDDLLCEVALCTNLVTQERYELVELWKKIEKWYA